MSLQSCGKCGYALSVIGSECRHCAAVSVALAPTKWRDSRLLLPLAAVACALAVLLYRFLVH
jgi:hypothetical protein